MQDKRWQQEHEAQRKRWEREDELQRQAWELEDRLRLYEERIKLYREFLTEARRLKNTGTRNLGGLQQLVEEIHPIGSNSVYVAATAVLPALLNFQQAREESSSGVGSADFGSSFIELESSL